MTRVEWIKQHPSAVLFAVQIAGLLLYPLMGSTSISRALFNAFGVGIVLLALWAVRFSPGLTWVGAALAMPAGVLLALDAFFDVPALGITSSVLEACLYVYAAGCMLAYMLYDADITTDEMWAVGATFTLLAWGFAHVFTVCQYVQPNSFTAAVAPEAQRTWIELLFLSVTTLTSTGLSDIVPIRPVARSLVMIEQIVGLAYVAMLVSRIVGLTMRGRTSEPK
ncbi:potassium channel family protein [Smaragdicoccus niigatensis]|uniref:potassium channel family protein n=1 Tax=Smaragdicoccus niigatensis TaxID=359359 RepID=UPI00035F5632|nr:potassium channel family protein [Smaragdicoccus niigatensis]